MKRRDALKNIGLSAGFIIATPSVISLLNSCNTDPNNWRPLFLNKEQNKVLMSLVDVILPKTDTSLAFCLLLSLSNPPFITLGEKEL